MPGGIYATQNDQMGDGYNEAVAVKKYFVALIEERDQGLIGKSLFLDFASLYQGYLLFISGSIWTILLISMVTYGFRLGGLLLANWLPQEGPFRRFLDALPGTILLSLVVPQALHAGIPGSIGLGACLAVFFGTRNLLFTMFAGVGAVWVVRALGLGCSTPV